jgi:hypothetical protein
VLYERRVIVFSASYDRRVWDTVIRRLGARDALAGELPRWECAKCQYGVTRQDADAGGRVAGVTTPVRYQRPGRLTLMRVQAVLKAPRSPLGPTSPSTCSSARQAFEAALRISSDAAELRGRQWRTAPILRLCLVEVSTVLRKANRRLVRWHEDADMREGCAGVGRGSALESWRSRGEIHRLATTHAWRIRPTAGNDLRCAKKGPLSLTPALSMPLW